jgi:succinoglycan biosynthesis transport protein ExoP
MSESEYEAQHSGMKFNDILFILFRHKWKILLLTASGIAAAAAVYIRSHTYASQAKLLVRYVVERTAIDKLETPVETPNSQNENILNSEVEILTSWDLATQVAETIGVERLMQDSGGKATTADAARSILKGLKVTPLKGSNIISASYQNKDPELAVRVLQDLVARYFDKHLEVHRSMGAFAFVKREADQVRTQLNETEEQLKQMKAKIGITSVAEGTTTLNTELAKNKADLAAAEAELAAQQARVTALERWVAATDKNESDNNTRQPSGKAVREYQTLFNRVAYLRQMETELLSKYTPENQMVKVKQVQIEDLEKQRRDLEQKYPSIVATILPACSSQNNRPDLVTERSRLVEIQARTETLRNQLSGVKERAKMLSEQGPQIAELERQKELEETNYKYFEASLERARIDETLDPSRMPNISVVQKPSPAVIAIGDVKKMVLGLAIGGLAIGIGLALLIELVLDRTIKRPLELETRLSIPLLLSIPNFGRNGQLRLRTANSNGDSVKGLPESSHDDIAAWESDHDIRPFCDAIRDRLAFYFEINRMTHKPKLVAVTGLSKGAGASTVAVGLAASLSEGGSGNVLLVDEQLDPKRFYDLVSQFKESDFDYVIFDLPFLSNTSPTLAMAGFVDKVLLVVEAEKSNRDTVKRAYEQLAAAKARVSVVFNKSRPYGLKWLECEV